MSTRLVVIRHGETQWNRASRVQGHGDSPLTAEGLAQAQAVGKRLANEPFDHLLSSDLGRALQTAEAKLYTLLSDEESKRLSDQTPAKKDEEKK